MASVGTDWKTRLAVEYKDINNDAKQISPIDSFAPSFTLNAEPLHSLEKTHIGVIFSPQSLSFTLTVKAIGPVTAALTKLALDGTRFDITMYEMTEDGQWSFNSIVMTNCVITSATPTTATLSGAPAATFSGFSLAASTDAKESAYAASSPWSG